jgi:hypothetical protein
LLAYIDAGGLPSDSPISAKNKYNRQAGGKALPAGGKSIAASPLISPKLKVCRYGRATFRQFLNKLLLIFTKTILSATGFRPIVCTSVDAESQRVKRSSRILQKASSDKACQVYY